ncbi:unnamed protein product [Ambrosiozyma monospora]|uniref:Unnamed protein product n=1 Tax=Ambrosiozyma monospora TaxID=43982 RepID=A0ACB5T2P1_AMBMO|nr:unnamed protein product [Ambrosiozyma monospora]
MVLAVTYKTSREYLNYRINRELLIRDEDEVFIKILNLFDTGVWFKLHGYYDNKKKNKMRELREKIDNEVTIYKHIWEHNNRLDDKDSDAFINVPKLIHYGEAPKDISKRFDVTSGTSEWCQILKASGSINRRSLYGPYLVLEFLKGMRQLQGEKEHDEVKKELAKLRNIGVRYYDERDPNFLFDPKTGKA